MRFRRLLKKLALCAATAGAATGCLGESGKVHYLGEADLKYYRGKATRIDYANVCNTPSRDVVATDEPRTVADMRKDEIYDVTLIEVLHTALSNNRIIRTAGQFNSPGNGLYSNPDSTPSVYDPAIRDSGVLFGGRGVEAALADFDAQYTTSMLWGRDERVQNNEGGPYGPGFTLQTDTANFNQRIQKQTAYGGVIGVNQTINYLYSNQPGTLFPSTYTGQLSVDYRQPLWAGSGVEYTRIAGPIGTGLAAITGVSQGVLISRINADITLADFEAQVRNMLKDVEDTYWDLYLSYRVYDTAVTARNSALRTWREEKLKLSVGKGEPADEAQARDQYFEARTQVNSALSNIYTNELRLRRMAGLPVNDCRILRPIDEPLTAEFVTDWRSSLAEALTKRVELRRQKWNIKSLELQLIAAKSLTHPRFDFVSQYRRNGFGDDLTGGTDDGVTPHGLESFYGTVANGNQDGWNLGFEFSMPLGFRSAHAQVRNIELRLAKAREVLSVQELEISHELAASLQTLTVNFANSKTAFNRRVAAEERVRLFSERERVGTVTTDLVLRAQASLAQADVSYFTNVINYTKSLTDYYFRRGTLLEHNNVRLAEDRWTPAAYKEALRRAWARSYALPNPLLDTEPAEFASPRPYKPRLPHAVEAGYEQPDGPISPPPEGARPIETERRSDDLQLPPEPPETPPARRSLPPMTRRNARAAEADDAYVEMEDALPTRKSRRGEPLMPERVRPVRQVEARDEPEDPNGGFISLSPRTDGHRSPVQRDDGALERPRPTTSRRATSSGSRATPLDVDDLAEGETGRPRRLPRRLLETEAAPISFDAARDAWRPVGPAKPKSFPRSLERDDRLDETRDDE